MLERANGLLCVKTIFKIGGVISGGLRLRDLRCDAFVKPKGGYLRERVAQTFMLIAWISPVNFKTLFLVLPTLSASAAGSR